MDHRSRETEDTKLARFYRDASNPEMALSEADLLGKIDTAARGRHSSAILLQGRPGDGTSFSLNGLLARSHETFGIPPNIIGITEPKDSDLAALSAAPYVIQSLLGRKVTGWRTHLRLRWSSLRARQKVLLGSGAALYLGLVNLITLDLTSVLQNPAGLQLKILVAHVLANLGAIALPLVAATLWRMSSKELLNEGLEDDLPKLTRILKRNNYSAVRKFVLRKCISRPAPVIIAIDSLDDLDQDFDWGFLETSLLPRLENRYQTLLIGVSKRESAARVRFLALAKEAYIYRLQPVDLDHLRFLTDQPEDVRQGMTVKEALRTRSRHQSLLETAASHLEETLVAYGSDALNLATLSIFVMQPYRHSTVGFSSARIRRQLHQIVELVKNLAPDLRIDLNLGNTLPSFLKQAVEEKILTYNPTAERYQTEPYPESINPLFQSSFWLAVSSLSWLTLSEVGSEQNPTGNDVFQAETLATDLFKALEGLSGETSSTDPNIDRTGALLSLVNFLDLTQRFGYAELSSKLARCGVMLVHTLRTKSPHSLAPSEVHNVLFENLVLFGRSNEREIDHLSRVQQSTDIDPEPTDGAAVADGSSASRWISFWQKRRLTHLPRLLQTEEIPLMLGDFLFRFLKDGASTGLAGGFNSNTYLRIFALSDAVDLHATQHACQILSDLSQGLTFLKEQQVTIWEGIWIQLVSLMSLFEYVRLLASASSTPRFNFEAYRQDLEPVRMDAELVEMMAWQAREINGLTMPSDQSPVTSQDLKSFREAFHELSLKLSLLGLFELNRTFEFFYLRFYWCIRSLERLSAEVRQEYFERLSSLATAQPSALQPDLDLESTILFYCSERTLDARSVGRLLLKIIDLLAAKGVPESELASLTRSRINDLLLSRHPRDRKAAAQLLLRQSRRQMRDLDLDGGTEYDADHAVRVCDTCDNLLLVANVLHGLDKEKSARIVWRCAHEVFDTLSIPRDAPESVHSSVSENNSFLLALQIWLWQASEDASMIPRVLGTLADQEYRKRGGLRYLTFLSAATTVISEEHLTVLASAVRDCAEASRYQEKRQWFFVLRSLVARRADLHDLHHGDPLLGAIVSSFDCFAACDRSNFSFDDFRAIAPTLLRLGQQTSGIDEQRVNAIHDDLLLREVVSIHADLLTVDPSDWSALEHIGQSYFRLLELRITDRFPPDIRSWQKQKGSYEIIRASGMSLIRKYIPQWQALPVMLRLSTLAREHRDGETQQKLRHNWRLAGLECIESLLRTAREAGFVANAIRDALDKQISIVEQLRQSPN